MYLNLVGCSYIYIYIHRPLIKQKIRDCSHWQGASHSDLWDFLASDVKERSITLRLDRKPNGNCIWAKKCIWVKLGYLISLVSTDLSL